jgi:hypothetical protein
MQIADSDNYDQMGHLRNNSDDEASSSNTHDTDDVRIEAVQTGGENNIWYRDICGDRPLTWSLYEQFNEWLIALDNDRGVFAAAFSKAIIAGAWSNTHNSIERFLDVSEHSTRCASHTKVKHFISALSTPTSSKFGAKRGQASILQWCCGTP